LIVLYAIHVHDHSLNNDVLLCMTEFQRLHKEMSIDKVSY